MNRIDRFFVWTDRFSDTQLTFAAAAAVVVCWSLITYVASVVLL